MKQLVKLYKSITRDKKRFHYCLDYIDEDGKRKRPSLGHADKRKAERQRAQFERELRMGIVAPGSLKLSEFLDDSLRRTGDQIRESSKAECASSMQDFIQEVGDIDFQSVTLDHAERYRQACLDRGNSPATVSKKLRHVKIFFALAVKRKQLDENPFQYVQMPKTVKKPVEAFTESECERILRAAAEYMSGVDRTRYVPWDLLIALSLFTGMRRGELMNLTWRDIDFDEQTVTVQPKENTAQTWKWMVKDSDIRVLPLNEQLIQRLAEHLDQQPSGYPYVLVPPYRYDHILHLCQQGRWDLNKTRERIIGNFYRQYTRILETAKVPKLKFHALRATALTLWLRNGMKEFDVMNLAGHSNFATTHKYYLAANDDLVMRARQASAKSVGKNLAGIWQAPSKTP